MGSSKLDFAGRFLAPRPRHQDHGTALARDCTLKQQGIRKKKRCGFV